MHVNRKLRLLHKHKLASFDSIAETDHSLATLIEMKIVMYVSPTRINNCMVSWHWPGNVISNVVQKWTQTYTITANKFECYKATFLPLKRGGRPERAPFPSELCSHLYAWVELVVKREEARIRTSIWLYNWKSDPRWNVIKWLRRVEVLIGHITCCLMFGCRSGEHTRGAGEKNKIRIDPISGREVGFLFRFCFIDPYHLQTGFPKVISGRMEFGQKNDNAPRILIGRIPSNKLANCFFWYFRRWGLRWSDDWFCNNRFWSILTSDRNRLVPLNTIVYRQFELSNENPARKGADYMENEQSLSQQTFNKDVKKMLSWFIEYNTKFSSFQEQCNAVSGHSTW